MPDLVGRLHADDLVGDLAVDVVDCLEDPFAQVAGLVAVTQFQRLALTRGCSGGHGGPAHGSRFEEYFDFQCRIPTGIENLPCIDVGNFAHYYPLRMWCIQINTGEL